VVSLLFIGGNRDPQHPSNNKNTSVDAKPKENPSIARPSKRDSPEHLENCIGMKLVLVPAGKFLMGSPVGEEGHIDDEFQHEVEITKPFYMGIHEVTQAQYETVIGENPSWFSRTGHGKAQVDGKDTSNFPVECVSMHDAVKFCAKLSTLEDEKKAGRKYRLPTEAEWEFACRAGTPSAYHFGATLTFEQANFSGKTGRTTPVGHYRQPSAFGLHDMHGNVWEWCADWYSKDFYRKSPKKDPECKDQASGCRVLRGGSWGDQPRNCRAAGRNYDSPDLRGYSSGFRVVCVASAKTP
jgi:formylglycine-generating enzyme required for sulfatase activity